MEMSESRPQEIEPEAVEARLIDAIREHPWLAVLGAAAIGFVAARLVRGER
jgi:ElaB/YqjD/DUF883 family membrane-anchored ribosome-binding protein